MEGASSHPCGGLFACKKLKMTNINTDKPNEYWQQFLGKENSDFVLGEKAKELVPLLVTLTAKSSEHFIEKAKKDYGIDQSKFDSLFIESLFFFIHYLNRFSLSSLGLQKRTVFMDKLFVELQAIMLVFSNSLEKKKNTTDFWTDFNKREIEYGEYKLALKDGSLAGTLFWEFGKKIADILNRKDNLSILMMTQGLIVNPVLTSLHLSELLTEEVKNNHHFISEEKVVKNLGSSASAELFLAFIPNGEELYDVFLVNPTDVLYQHVKKLTGGYASYGDDELSELGRSVWDLPSLDSHSYIKIGDLSVWFELDYVIWYYLDLVSSSGIKKYVRGSIPKYITSTYRDKKTLIPELGKEGIVLELKDREDNKSIEEVVKTLKMNARFITFNKDGTVKSEEE